MCQACSFEMPYGKYQGEELGTIRLFPEGRDYLMWMSDNTDNEEVLYQLDEVLEEHQ